MATSPWKDIRIEQPTDLTDVWVRQPFGNPFQATWSETAATFHALAPAPENLDVPWYEIDRWRPI